MSYTEYLKNIASVKTGYTFRGRIQSDVNTGTMRVLQPKDIGLNQIEQAAMINPDSILSVENHLLKKGDILIANKGTKFATHLINDDKVTIASSSFFVIRFNYSNILPEYLLWYLEQETAKEYLQSKITGTTIPTINKSVLENMLIPVPQLKIQQQAINLKFEIDREIDLLKILQVKKAQLRDSYIWNLIQ